VIERLGFGRTYPIRDLSLPDQLFVASGSSIAVTLEYSQRDVDYQLRDYESGQPIPRSSSDTSDLPGVPGTDGPLALWTPPVVRDVRYRVLAVKREASPAVPRRETWLAGTVSIAEGIDKALVAELRLPPLDAGLQSPRPGDARISHYHQRVEIELQSSQEGVTYELVDHVEPTRSLSEPVLGTGSGGITNGRIVLVLRTVEEDVDLRVRGSRAIAGATNPQRDVALLDVVLSLRVRANPALPAVLDPAIVAHGGSSELRLAETQPGVGYRAWQRAVRDRDFVFEIAPELATLLVQDENRAIPLWRPERAAIWKDLDFAPLGVAHTGVGAALALPLGAFERDVYVLVEAAKEHRTGLLGSSSATIRSATQLDTALALLVRPNAQQLLRAQVTLAQGATTGALVVSGGQPGVYYALRSAGAIRPAYFHQRDDTDATVNKGIDQLRLEVDFALARDRPGSAGPNHPGTPPLDPALDSETLPVGTVLNVLARKALSGLEQILSRALTLDAAPAIRIEPVPIQRGRSANVVVEQSVVGDRYTLLQDEAVMGEARDGNGKALTFATGALSESRVFVLTIERGPPAGLPVQRRVELPVEVAADG
jgi:hypothetical protein